MLVADDFSSAGCWPWLQGDPSAVRKGLALLEEMRFSPRAKPDARTFGSLFNAYLKLLELGDSTAVKYALLVLDKSDLIDATEEDKKQRVRNVLRVVSEYSFVCVGSCM